MKLPLTLLNLLLMASLALGFQAQQTNTNGVNIDTDSEKNNFRKALDLPQLQGFGTVDPSTISLAVTNTGNDITLTVTPVSPATTFAVYAGPTPLYATLTGAQTKTVTGATSTNYFFYYENVAGTMTLQASTSPWVIGNHAPLCFVLWDATAQTATLTLWEMHNTSMDDATHLYNHATSGTKYVANSGLGLVHNATTGTPNADGRNTMIGITPGKIRDEDIEVLTVNGTSGTVKWEQDHGSQVAGSLVLANGGQFPVIYSNGSRAIKLTSNDRFPFLFTSNIPNYVNSGGTVTAVTEDQRFGYWLCVTADLADPICLIPHRAVYTTLPLAQAGMSLASLVTDLQGIPTPEILAAYRVIFRYNATGANSGVAAHKFSSVEDVTDFRASQVALITGTSANNAAAVTFTPAGNIGSTNVQSAIEEIDTEKVGLTGDETIAGVKTFSSAGIFSGDLTVDTSTFKVDSATNRVGIGTASPQNPLHILGERSDATPTAGVSIFGSNDPSLTGYCGIEFHQNIGTEIDFGNGSGSNDYLGRIAYVNSTNRMAFSTNSAERLVIGSTGIVTVAASGTLGFASNSGTWNGSTMAGAQTFSGVVTFSSKAILPVRTPSSATDTGTAGEVVTDANYIYVCTATNTWKRSAITTW